MSQLQVYTCHTNTLLTKFYTASWYIVHMPDKQQAELIFDYDMRTGQVIRQNMRTKVGMTKNPGLTP